MYSGQMTWQKSRGTIWNIRQHLLRPAPFERGVLKSSGRRGDGTMSVSLINANTREHMHPRKNCLFLWFGQPVIEFLFLIHSYWLRDTGTLTTWFAKREDCFHLNYNSTYGIQGMINSLQIWENFLSLKISLWMAWFCSCWLPRSQVLLSVSMTM